MASSAHYSVFLLALSVGATYAMMFRMDLAAELSWDHARSKMVILIRFGLKTLSVIFAICWTGALDIEDCFWLSCCITGLRVSAHLAEYSIIENIFPLTSSWKVISDWTKWLNWATCSISLLKKINRTIISSSRKNLKQLCIEVPAIWIDSSNFS